MWRTESRPDHRQNCQCDQCAGFPWAGWERVTLKAVLDLAGGDRIEICSEFSAGFEGASAPARLVKQDGSTMAIGVYNDLLDAVNAAADVVRSFGLSPAEGRAAREAEAVVTETER